VRYELAAVTGKELLLALSELCPLGRMPGAHQIFCVRLIWRRNKRVKTDESQVSE
jgi:hypothetical protein